MAELLGLPATLTGPDAGGVIQGTASEATLCAALAARERATGGQANRTGVPAGLVAYATAHAHSSIEKALRIAGIGAEHIRVIPHDTSFAMRPEALAAAIADDRAAGRTPFFAVASIGTTSSMAVDPVRAVGEICRREGLWLHVDAAMAGTAALCPEFRFIHDGLEFADSYVFNPHKWMFTNFDCSAFFVADRSALVAALGILPEYLRNRASEQGAVIDYRDWQVPLGRRFRALKLWFVIRHYGIEGLHYHVRRHVALAQELKQWVVDSADFELAVDTPLNLICFRHRGGDAETERVHQAVNASGKVYLTHTKLDGRYTLRLCIGQMHTEREHVQQAWDLLQVAAKR
jgi:aromatic-L-amino-acid decarboxylase